MYPSGIQHYLTYTSGDLPYTRRDFETWDGIVNAILKKYFPPIKTIRIRKEISGFMQGEDESLSEAWERFKDLIRSCPQHGFNNEQRLGSFYNGMNSRTRSMVDASAGGSLLKRR